MHEDKRRNCALQSQNLWGVLCVWLPITQRDSRVLENRDRPPSGMHSVEYGVQEHDAKVEIVSKVLRLCMQSTATLHCIALVRTLRRMQVRPSCELDVGSESRCNFAVIRNNATYK